MKYKAFARKDVDNWSIIWNFPFYITFWPRLGVAILNTILYSSFVIICMLGVDYKDHDIGAVRKNLIGYVGYASCRLHCLMGSLLWVKVEYVSTGEGDYRKWLGPDWKPKWKGVGTIVSNHVCWMDIVMSRGLLQPSFVSKKSVASYPGVGTIAKAIDCVFLDRAGTKEEKIAIGKQIEDRQLENETHGRAPLLIYPEGATTNND